MVVACFGCKFVKNLCMEILNQAPVTFTVSAIEELQRLHVQQAADKFLRVGVKGGGCSGLSYILEFDDKKENDELYVIEGIPCVIINKQDSSYLSIVPGMVELHVPILHEEQALSIITQQQKEERG
jgi:hypothetical protein